MKERTCGTQWLLLSVLVLGSSGWAHESGKATPAVQSATWIPGQGMPAYVQDIAPGTADAVKVVDAFAAAIKAVKLADAGQLLDPKVLILESGGSERSRDEYLAEHAIADAAFMQTAHQQLRYRQAQVEGDLAWVGTESELQTVKNKKPFVLLSTETMVLRKTAQGWKIVHIHWSSRPATKS